MNCGYTKLFHKILHSSIWDKDDRTRLIWITLLAMRDKNGVIESTMNGISRASRIPVEDCRRAIEEFLKPDGDSLTSQFEGRRLEVVEGGWRLLNHRKYVQMMGEEDRREYWREKKAEQRAKELEDVKDKAADREYKKRRKVLENAGKVEGATKAVNDGLADLKGGA